MKRLIILFTVFLASQLHAQTIPSGKDTISGVWAGQIGKKLTLVFHFSPTADGHIQGIMDSPDQGISDLPIQSIAFQQDSITCMLTKPVSHYTARRTDDTTLSGLWYQSGLHFPLTVHRLSDNAALAYEPPPHPQTPHPPYPYNSDSVEYDNTDKTVHLGATLTYPKTKGPFPAAILITGSGIQDRDEALLGHKPFAVIADYLTRHGYAVLRVDDRQAGLSKGDLDSATSADFADDVATSLAWLKKQKEIDPKKIGLIGHSEGAAIAPILASRNKDVAFIISLAGPSDGYKTLMYQTEKAMLAADSSDAQVGYALKKESILLTAIETAKTREEFVQQADHNYQAYYKALPDDAKAILPFIATPEVYAKSIQELSPRIFTPWWRFLITYKADPYYEKVKCPVLLLGGAKDFQVNNSYDIKTITAILKNSGNNHVESKLFPDLNHLFQHCHTCTFAEYSKLEETFAPEALSTMTDWLDKTIKH